MFLKNILKKMIIQKNCTFDVIYVKGPSEHQYDVFSSINSAGKKLTIEEKIKNYLLLNYSEGELTLVKEIADNPGFAKAFCECINGKFCESDAIIENRVSLISLRYGKLDKIL